jgi:hypothetical protein
MDVVRGVCTIELIMTGRQQNLPMNEENTMISNKELTAPKELTTTEIKGLVDEFLAKGGKITQCAPNVALNFRSAGEVIHPPRPHRLKKNTLKPTKKKKKK